MAQQTQTPSEKKGAVPSQKPTSAPKTTDSSSDFKRDQIDSEPANSNKRATNTNFDSNVNETKKDARQMEEDEDVGTGGRRQEGEWQVPGQDEDPGVEMPRRDGTDTSSRRWV